MKIKNKLSKKLFSILFIAVALPVSVIMINKVTNLKPRAQFVTPEIYLQPSTGDIVNGTVLRIFMNPLQNKPAFIRLVLNFDKAKLRLASEVAITTSINDIIRKSTMAQANASGQIEIALAAPKNAALPSSVFEIASFRLDKISTTANDVTTITISDPLNPYGIQIVDDKASQMNVVAGNTTFTLNPAQTQTVTSTLGPTSTGANSTLTPTATSVPMTITSTPSVIPTGQGSSITKFDWETSSDGWRGASSNVSTYNRASVYAKNGKYSFSFYTTLNVTSSEAMIRKVYTAEENWSSQGRTLSGYVYIPSIPNQTGSISANLYIENASGVRSSGPSITLSAGTWNYLAWTEAPLANIKNIGVRVAANNQSYTGRFYVDYITLGN